MKSFLSNSLIMLIGANLGNGLNFLSHILIARLLLPQDFGLFQSLISLTGIAGVIFSSLSLVIVNQASQTQSKTFSIKPFFNLSFKLSLLLSLLLLILFPYLSLKLSIPNFGTYFIFLLILLTSFIPVILGSLLQAKLQFYKVGLISITAGLTKLLFIWIFLNLNLKASGALLAILATTIISSLLTYQLTKSYINHKSNKLPLKFILTTTMVNLGLISLISSDVVLARVFFSPHQSGLYAAAASLAKIIFFAISPIFTVTFPLFSTVHLGGAHLLKQAGLLISSLVILIFIIFKLNPQSIINLIYDTNYQSASTFLPLLSLTMLIYTLFYLSIQYLLAKHHPSTVKIISATAILQILLIIFYHPTPTSIITNSIISISTGLLLCLTKVSPLLKINK